MLEIFLVQLLAAALGAASTASADWFYHSARIGQGLHAFWVSASIALICLPVLAWTCTVFLGSGMPGQLVAGLVVCSIFLCVHRSLRKLPPQNLELRLPAPHPSTEPLPPPSELNS
jgi:hypothetical protein